MPTCNQCDDTGEIDTGNNVLPCQCPAGDTAIFRFGDETLTGAEIKRRNSLPQMPRALGDRTEHGHLFRWYARPYCWHSTEGQAVLVVPPRIPHETWLVIIPGQNRTCDCHGHDAEQRAFSIAEVYTRQENSAGPPLSEPEGIDGDEQDIRESSDILHKPQLAS